MSGPSPPQGAAIVWHANGAFARVARDDLGIFARCAPGTAFVELFDLASMEKAAEFFEAVRNNGAAFDWQLNAVAEGAIALLHCIGWRDGEMLWFALARSRAAALAIFEEMSATTSTPAAAHAAAAEPASGPSTAHGPDQAQFEELTRLYNELGRTQRVVAQRNAELEAVRATLEAKQAELLAANGKLEAMATTDGLTGIANRRAFQQRLEAECSRAGRDRQPLSLLIFDLDHFKSLNDTYGHQAGDEVLTAMGRLLATAARNTDFVARYGGEEFVAILINTDEAGSRHAAERLRGLIEAGQWPHRRVTASIGAASREPGGGGASELIRMADAALYESKRHGRNRVTHWRDIGPTSDLPAPARSS